MKRRRTIAYVYVLAGFLFTFFGTLFARPTPGDTSHIEEVPVELRLSEVGTRDATFLHKVNGPIFVNVEELFSFCKIAYTQDSVGTLRGFYLSTKVEYLIDPSRGHVSVGDSSYEFSTEKFIRKGNIVFIEPEVLAEAFAIYINFQFDELTASITSKYVMPAVVEHRRQRTHGQSDVATPFAGNNVLSSLPDYSLGTIDWFINSSASVSGPSIGLATSLGGRIAGGETRLDVSVTPERGIDRQGLRGYWRYAFTRDELLPSALELGDVNGDNLRALPLRGFHITNAPLAPRHVVGVTTYEHDIPVGWQAETYLNNELIEFSEGAPAQTHFVRNLPLFYGSSYLTTHLYGPHGEEEIENNVFTVPSTLLPKGNIEYSASYGVCDLYRKTIVGSALFRWAPIDRIALGGGVETAHDVLFAKTYPFFSLSSRPADAFIVTGSIAPGVILQSEAQWVSPSMIVLHADGAWMDPFSIYNPTERYRSELNASAFAPVPFLLNSATTTSRLRRITTGDIQVTSYSSMFGFATRHGQWNIRFAATDFIAPMQPHIKSSTFSAGYSSELLRNFFLSSQLGTAGKSFTPSWHIENIEIGASLRFSQHIQLSMQFQHLVSAQNTSLFISLSFDAPFARSRFSISNIVTDGRSNVTANQFSQGSVTFLDNEMIWGNNGFSVGKGGLIVEPFLDENGNGVRDSNEVTLREMDILYRQPMPRTMLSGGQEFVSDIPAYTSYRFSLGSSDDASLPWVAKEKEYAVDISPGATTVVSIPVYPNTELTGSVMDDHGRALAGLSVIVRDSSGERRRSNVFSNGGFSVYGITPGDYIVTLDSVELVPLGFIASIPEIHVTIPPTAQQQIISNISFILKH